MKPLLLCALLAAAALPLDARADPMHQQLLEQGTNGFAQMQRNWDRLSPRQQQLAHNTEVVIERQFGGGVVPMRTDYIMAIARAAGAQNNQEANFVAYRVQVHNNSVLGMARADRQLSGVCRNLRSVHVNAC